MTKRTELLQHIANAIFKLPADNVIRVAIDGVDGAGKTVFGDELSYLLQPFGRQVIRASVDSFHNPRHIRYKRGASSPEGFFRDSYNYKALITYLLRPLSPDGSRRFHKSAFDHRTNAAVVSDEEYAEPSAILIFDGIFLHRPELQAFWDFSIFIDVDFTISIPRGAQRGEGSPDPLALSNQRYVQGQKIYLSECNPKVHASVVVNNEDLEKPYIVN